MENVQTLLTIVVIALTVLLIIIGVQVALMIMELRRALRRLNNILDDSVLGGGLLRPEKLTGIIELIRRRGFKNHGQAHDPTNQV